MLTMCKNKKIPLSHYHPTTHTQGIETGRSISYESKFSVFTLQIQ